MYFYNLPFKKNFFKPLQVSDPLKIKEKTPTSGSIFICQKTRHGTGRFFSHAGPCQSQTGFLLRFSADYYWKAYHIRQTQDTAGCVRPQSSIQQGPGPQHTSQPWQAGLEGLSMLADSPQTCSRCADLIKLPPTTGCERIALCTTVFSHPSTAATPRALWLGHPQGSDAGLGASPEPWWQNDGRGAH